MLHNCQIFSGRSTAGGGGDTDSPLSASSCVVYNRLDRLILFKSFPLSTFLSSIDPPLFFLMTANCNSVYRHCYVEKTPDYCGSRSQTANISPPSPSLPHIVLCLAKIIILILKDRSWGYRFTFHKLAR